MRFTPRASWWRSLRRALHARPKLSPTSEGLYLSLISLSLGVAASSSGNNLLYLIVGMTLALIVSSGLLSSLNLHKLRVRSHAPSLVYAAEPVAVSFVVRNLKRRLPSLSVTLREAAWRCAAQERGGLSAELNDQEERFFYLFVIAPDTSTRLEAPYTFPSRGRYHLEGGRLFTRFPFGLFEKSLGLYTTAHVAVSARRHALPPELAERLLRLNTGAHDRQEHRHDRQEEREGSEEQPTQSPSGRGLKSGDELMGVRLLSPHEPVSKIHWGATARRGALVKREYAPERPVRRVLWVNEHITVDPARLHTRAHDAWADLVASCVEALSRSAPLHVMTSSGARWLIEGEAQGEAQRAREALALWLVDAQLTHTPLTQQDTQDKQNPPPGAVIITHPQGRALLPAHTPPELIFESEEGQEVLT